MPIFPISFFSFMGCNFTSFSFFSVWHNSHLVIIDSLYFHYFYSFIGIGTFFFTNSVKDFAGLNAGILCAGITIDISLDI